MKKKIKGLKEHLERSLRYRCSRMTPRRRLIAIVALGAVFGLANIYTTAKAIYDIGREDKCRQRVEMQHIKPLELPKRNDTISENEDNK